MALRLPVVLSQSDRPSQKRNEHEENWITRLLFEERLDATLVSDLSAIEIGSTDQLCFEGLKGDFILLSWQSPLDSHSRLSHLGLEPCELVPIDRARESGLKSEQRMESPTNTLSTPPAPSGRTTSQGRRKKIYFLQLTLERSVDRGIGMVKEVLKSLSTPVFQLQGLSGGIPASIDKFQKSNPLAPAALERGPSTSSQNRSNDPALTIDTPRPGAIQPDESKAEIAMQKQPPLESELPSQSRPKSEILDVPKMDDEFPNLDALMQEMNDIDL